MRKRCCSLAEIAVARRGVVAPGHGGQRYSAHRLTEAEHRIYDNVTMQLHIDARAAGRIVHRGRDSDRGTLSSRLAAAEARLPD